jgi:hypothetical protein
VERSSEEGPEPRGGNGPSLFTELPRGCVLGNSKTIEGQGVGAPALPYSPTFRERLFPETSDSPAPLGECLGDWTRAIGKTLCKSAKPLEDPRHLLAVVRPKRGRTNVPRRA